MGLAVIIILLMQDYLHDLEMAIPMDDEDVTAAADSSVESPPCNLDPYAMPSSSHAEVCNPYAMPVTSWYVASIMGA